ncbi:MAG TPA: hypothetical protein GX510_06050 [Firmicutes bacterium]|nr:hypothetical protein [Candidatus Fermentithermobacillaceae bacterium]
MSTFLSPHDFFGFAPGEDRKLLSWAEITSYLEAVSGASPRVRRIDMGATTEGRPFYYLVISSPENLTHLDDYREIQAKLADPRRVSLEEAEDLVGRGKVVVLVTCSIHATEVGAAQMTPVLVHEFAGSDDPELEEILDNVIFLLVPSLNPDGLDLVVDWYRRTLNTKFEGTAPPMLYHKYAGHDNNRDWFMLNLVETRLVVEKIHNVWHPQIVLDLHEMSSDGFRMFLPPYVDPYDPNVDYILQQEINALGTHIMAELLSRGKAGVSCHSGFDAYTPARAYQHYHGGVRILSELASAKLASPVAISRDELKPAPDGQDPRQSTWAQPLPWKGGEWRLRDIIEYEMIAVRACLLHAARWRRMWLWNFYDQARRWLERREPPFAYIFPCDQRDPGALLELIEVLQKGMVEVEKAVEPFVADGITYPAGTLVVKLQQPYGRYAKTLLEIQRYPDIRQYAGGPPKPPYDVTGHTLPLAMGVKCVEVSFPFSGKTVPFFAQRGFSGQPFSNSLTELAPDSWSESGRTREEIHHENVGVSWAVLPPFENAAFWLVNRLLASGVPVWRTPSPVREGEQTGWPTGKTYPPGTFFFPAEGLREMPQPRSARFSDAIPCSAAAGSEASSSPSPLKVARWRGSLPRDCRRLSCPRVAVYKSDRPFPSEGWLRLVLERYGFAYSSVGNRHIRQGNLRESFDVLVVPSQPAGFIRKGNPRGTLPPEYTGGWEEPGKLAVLEFVEAGGTLIMLDRSCQWALEELGVPVKNVMADLKTNQFFCPGSILRVIVDPEHPVGFGLPTETAVMFARSCAWDLSSMTPSSLKVVARYPEANPLLSGWLLGDQFLHGKAAVVEYRLGAGHVILMGFEPHFRAQFTGTYKFLFNAIFLSLTGDGGGAPAPQSV